jgi:hypothetical protein
MQATESADLLEEEGIDTALLTLRPNCQLSTKPGQAQRVAAFAWGVLGAKHSNKMGEGCRSPISFLSPLQCHAVWEWPR